MRAVLVVEAAPILEPARELRGFETHRRPELLEGGALDALDLAVQVRCAWAVGPELDAPVLQALLDPVGEELPAAVGLDALHREGHAGAHPLEEVERAGGIPVRIDAQHLPAGAVVDRGVLVEDGGDLAGVELDAARPGPVGCSAWCP